MCSGKYPKLPRKFYRRVKDDTEKELFILNAEHDHELPLDESYPVPVNVPAVDVIMPSTSQEGLLESHLNSDEDSSNQSEVSHEEALESRPIHQLLPTTPKEGSDSDNGNPSEWSLETFKTDLANWAVTENIAHSKLSSLLKILKKHEDFKKLPVDARSLLKTPRESDIIELCGGSFVYFGVVEGVKKILTSESTLPENIDLLVSVDGLPISKSSGSQLWPQLGRIRSLPHTPVFVIGIFHGSQKPYNSNDFLNDLVEELKLCVENGIMLNEKVVNVSHVAFVCDAPAKSFILQTKGHTGYFSCTRCKDEGQYINGRISFSVKSGPYRTHNDFVNQVQEEYHVGESILVNIPKFNAVRDLPLDYMHLVCLGVVKKILNLWMRGSLRYRLSNNQVCKINTMLKSFRRSTPTDFVRKPRGLDELARWKATELRFFLLYAGPVVLAKEKDFRPDIAENFITLSVAMNLLLNPSTCYDFKDYVTSLLETFVVNFKKLYGNHLVSHNVHGLLHLADDVTTFGALDNCSAFTFENYMQTLKSLMRKHHVPLQQICKRLQEKFHNMLSNPKIVRQHDFKNSHESGPLTEQCTNPQYRTLQTQNFKLACNDKDGFCILYNQDIVKVNNFAFCPERNDMVLIGKEYESARDLFRRPFKSSKLQMSLIVKKSEELKVWSVNNIHRKMVVFPFKRNLLAAMPLIHC